MRPVSRKTLAQSFQCARAVGKQKIFIEFVKRRARVDATRELRCYTLLSPPLPSSSLSTNHTCGSHTHIHILAAPVKLQGRNHLISSAARAAPSPSPSTHPPHLAYLCLGDLKQTRQLRSKFNGFCCVYFKACQNVAINKRG